MLLRAPRRLPNRCRCLMLPRSTVSIPLEVGCKASENSWVSLRKDYTVSNLKMIVSFVDSKLKPLYICAALRNGKNGKI